MKTRIVLIVLGLSAMFGVNSANAQEDCTNLLSLFYNDAKVKNYEAAYPNWKKVFDDCPADLNVATYVYGDNILEYKIEKDPANKQMYIDLLLEVYDRHHKTYPTGKNSLSYGEMVIEKVKLRADHGLIEDQETYDLLKDAFEKDNANFDDSKALYMYFLAAVELYKAEKIDLQVIFDAYDDINGKLETLQNEVTETVNPIIEAQEAGTALTAKQEKTLKYADIKMKNYEGIAGSMNAYIVQLADCPALIKLYNRDFEEKKNDEQWLNRAAARLDEKDCKDDPLFAKIVEQLHGIHPSASSARFLGKLALQKKDKPGAKKWFKEAYELEEDKFKKSNSALLVAQLSSGSEAASWAEKAKNHNPSNKKAWDIIANAYSESANECGTTTFEKKSVYWLAAEAARKGTKPANASKYEALAPSRAEIFESGMAGKSIKINCWINKTIKVPSLK